MLIFPRGVITVADQCAISRDVLSRFGFLTGLKLFENSFEFKSNSIFNYVGPIVIVDLDMMIILLLINQHVSLFYMQLFPTVFNVLPASKMYSYAFIWRLTLWRNFVGKYFWLTWFIKPSIKDDKLWTICSVWQFLRV